MPEYIKSNSDVEMTCKLVRNLLANIGAKIYIELNSPVETRL